MRQAGRALHTVLFLAFLAFVMIVIIGPSMTNLAVARAETAPTGMSVSAVILALLFPVLAITIFIAIQAYKAIKRDRQF